MRLFCNTCFKSVSNELPEDTTIRAALVCPECIEAGKVVFPDEPDYRKPQPERPHDAKYFCNKCGYVGQEGPQHPNCNYFAAKIDSTAPAKPPVCSKCKSDELMFVSSGSHVMIACKKCLHTDNKELMPELKAAIRAKMAPRDR